MAAIHNEQQYSSGCVAAVAAATTAATVCIYAAAAMCENKYQSEKLETIARVTEQFEPAAAAAWQTDSRKFV